MSYLDDEPFTPDEERHYKRTIRKFNLSNTDPAPQYLTCTGVINKQELGWDINTNQQIRSDYFKLDLRNSNDITLSNHTYHRLMLAVKRRYGHFPSNGGLICDLITIIPKPNARCSLYYYSGEIDKGDTVNYELISSFVNDEEIRKLSVGCPFTDSLKSADKHVIFPWFRNTRTGLIVPEEKVDPRYVLEYANSNMPWLSWDPIGSFIITGIVDAVAFHCIFCIDPCWNTRTTRTYQGAVTRKCNKLQREREDLNYHPESMYRPDPLQNISVQTENTVESGQEHRRLSRRTQTHDAQSGFRNMRYRRPNVIVGRTLGAVYQPNPHDVGYEVPSEEYVYDMDQDPLLDYYSK